MRVLYYQELGTAPISLEWLEYTVSIRLWRHPPDDGLDIIRFVRFGYAPIEVKIHIDFIRVSRFEVDSFRTRARPDIVEIGHPGCPPGGLPWF